MADRQRLEELRARARLEELRARAGGQNGQSAPRPDTFDYAAAFEREAGATRPSPDRSPEAVRAASQAYASRPGEGIVGFLAGGAAEGLNASDELRATGARVFNLIDNRLRGDRRVDLDPRIVAETERARVESARQDQPIAQGVREGIGLAPTAVIGGAGRLASAAGGALVGGVTGYFGGQTPEQRAQGATVGAGAGAALGAAADEIGRRAGQVVTGPLARAVQRRLAGESVTRGTTAQRQAFAELRRAAEQEGITGQDFVRLLRQFEANGFDDATLFDAGAEGGPIRRLIEGAGVRGGGAAASIQSTLRSRQEQQPDRVANLVATYISPSANLRSARDQLVQTRQELAAPLYDEFRRQPPIRRNVRQSYGHLPSREAEMSRQLDKLFETPLFASLARMARSSAATRDGVVIDIDREVTPDALQRIYATLGEQIRAARRAGQATREGDLMGLMSRYRQFLDTAYPDVHARARNVYSSQIELEDALDAGRNAFRGDAEDLSVDVSSMNAGQREMYRAGLVRAVREATERVQDNRELVRVIAGTRDKRQRLATAFENPEDFAQFLSSLRAEQSRVTNLAPVAPQSGSPTARRMTDQAASAGGAILDAVSQNWLGLFSRGARAIADTAETRFRQQVDEELVRLALTAYGSRGAASEMALEQINAQYGQETANLIRQAISASALPAIAVTTN